MSLQLFFSPLSHGVFRAKTLGYSIQRFEDEFPNWQKCKAAIFSIDQDFEPLREMLSNLAELSSSIQIADLGVLRNGQSPEETQERLSQVCAELLRNHVLPIVLSERASNLSGLFWAYVELGKMVSLLLVDKKIDLEKAYLEQIVLHENLFSYSHLGYQRFLTDSTTLNSLLGLGSDLKSLGQMRDDFSDVEATVRNADLIGFDWAALKVQHAFGINSEEACQICWYAGVSPRLSAICFSGMSSSPYDIELASAMIWYLLEGLGAFGTSRNLSLNHCRKIIVFNSDISQEIIFYHNEFTDQWWLEVPAKNSLKKPILACSHSDYLTAQNGEIPQRYLKGIETYLG
jgi:formiminoglutamase